MSQTTNVTLAEQDIAYTLLCDLKRVTREYATAATESTCPEMRTLYTQLLNRTLHSQGELFTAMQSAQLYDQPLIASQTDISQQITSFMQTEQKLVQFITQHQQLVGQAAIASTQSTQQI